MFDSKDSLRCSFVVSEYIRSYSNRFLVAVSIFSIAVRWATAFFGRICCEEDVFLNVGGEESKGMRLEFEFATLCRIKKDWWKQV